ncbi:hypothetical protein UUU_04450 [Klebsiella pneumoniae subsp. pneumoniae DSM 30104 = JCM 1662 = NBRC 14940]|nr:hypothetical protein UUU_04450 [Klebsiella pneumoniae subsp. pneumoniae DSM 30104 = JCM 1662 = NBRC 14940]
MEPSCAFTRPRRVRFGKFSGPLRPWSASPLAQASAMWPSVSAPTSPKRSASSVAPIPKESSTMINARFILFSIHLALQKSDQISISLFSDTAIDCRCNFRGFIVQFNGRFDRFRGLLPAVLVFGMDHRQRTLSVDAVTQTRHLGKANAIVNGVRCLTAAAAHRNHCHAQRASIHRADKTFGISIDCFAQHRRRQIISIILDKVARPFLRRDHAAKHFRRFTVIQHRLQLRARLGIVRRQLAGDQHFHTQRHCHVEQARVAVFAGQELHRFANFNGVAGAGGQYLIHIGQQRGGAHAGAVGDTHDRFGQRGREFISRHKRAAADFDVHHQRIQPFRQLLRQNRGGNQRDGVHRRGNIAGGIETFVGRGKGAGLPDNCHANIFNNLAEAVVVREDIEARDRFQFVQRTAGMAEAAAGDHRYVTTAGGHHRPQHQRSDIPDAAGRVFIDDRTVKVEAFPVQNGTGIPHRHGQRNALRHRHIVEEDGHRQRGDLPFRDSIVADAVDEKADLFIA